MDVQDLDCGVCTRNRVRCDWRVDWRDGEVKIDHWITFTSEMLLTVMEGTKTETRRVIVPQPTSTWCQNVDRFEFSSDGYWYPTSPSGKQGCFEPVRYRCPYGEPGDILGVKEGYQIADTFQLRRLVGIYLVDGAQFSKTPGRFMYRSLCRTRLEVLSVKVERVQEITGESVISEGVIPCVGNWDLRCLVDERNPGKLCPVCTENARIDFAIAWDRINKKRGYGWNTNPRVWVVKFRRIEE